MSKKFLNKVNILNRWVITRIPVGKDAVPLKWRVSTRYNILGFKFIIWELK